MQGQKNTRSHSIPTAGRVLPTFTAGCRHENTALSGFFADRSTGLWMHEESRKGQGHGEAVRATMAEDRHKAGLQPCSLEIS